MKLNYYKNLDGLRAIAALMVIIFHFLASFSYDSKIFLSLKKISIFGQTGVDLFFVLSGFLITRILLKTKKGNNYFLNFYSRRTLRIFPLYYFFLVLFYLIVPFLTNVPSFSFGEQLYFYTYLQNISVTFNLGGKGPHHYWSLAVEEHFYLFWPLFIYFLNKKFIKYVVLGIVFLTILLRIIMVSNEYGVFYFTFTRFDSLAIGALLALLELKSFFTVANRKKFVFGISVFFVLLIIWAFAINNHLIKETFKYLIYSCLYFFVIAYILSLDKSSYLNKFLTSKILQFLGKISYGLYVYHPLVLIIMHKYLVTGYLLFDFIVLIIFTVIISHFSFVFFESKFIKLKKYFEYP